MTNNSLFKHLLLECGSEIKNMFRGATMVYNTIRGVEMITLAASIRLSSWASQRARLHMVECSGDQKYVVLG